VKVFSAAPATAGASRHASASAAQTALARPRRTARRKLDLGGRIRARLLDAVALARRVDGRTLAPMAVAISRGSASDVLGLEIDGREQPAANADDGATAGGA